MVVLAVLMQLVPIFTPQPPVELPERVRDCRWSRITGYVRESGGRTYDGTDVMTGEPIAAASYDIEMGSMVEVVGVGWFRVADRGMLSPTHVDLAVWSATEAYALTSTRLVCLESP